MSKNPRDSDNNLMMEFMAEEIDPFSNVRQRGPKRWLTAHILQGSNKIFVLMIFSGTIVYTVLSSGIMIIVGNAIDEFISGNSTNFALFIVLIFAFGVASPFLHMINGLLTETLAQRMERDTRHEFYTNLLGKSQSFHDQQRIGDIMARTTNDVRMLNFLISPALSLIFESFIGLIVPILFIILFFPTQLLLAPILFTIFFLITLRRYVNRLGPVSGRLRMEFGQMNAILNETLSGIEVVKGSATEDHEIRKYFTNAKGYRDAFVEQGEIMARYIPLLLVAFAVTLGLGHAIFLNLEGGGLEIGQIIAYVGLLSNLRFPTFISIWTFAVVRLAVSGAERLLEAMSKESDIDENIKGQTVEIKGGVSFKNVTFIYPGSAQPVLHDINFEVQPGQTVAIVGTTGSGKTTLTKLISRLYDLTEGQVLVDGYDVREYNLESLRSQISYIEQDVFLFSSSIFENISFGKTSSIDQVINVAKEAQAHDFITKLPEGYDTEVGERGVQLSGGERQRVAIARAFLADPKILILDDSTSAIDSKTEDKIQYAISNVLKGRTTFIITHRLSQIRWADLILVMKRGTVIAQGTHEDLIRTSEEYRAIFVKRFDLEEDQLLKDVAVV
ncbi:MAG: ABC transporter ATP-binding protein [Candidatus Heimdallarchaeota archaeon]|nr:MAG: ABC transporter ATP-binding protein [Candidatus Heimdallarchaeota archaeon]